jgi:Cys-tRNA(Pro)/Cys-tRNA(Cys) deacylase
MGSQGTRAISAARRAGVVHTVHEYAAVVRPSLRDGGRGYALEAVEALGIVAGRVFKTIVVSVDGRPGLAVVPRLSG